MAHGAGEIRPRHSQRLGSDFLTESAKLHQLMETLNLTEAEARELMEEDKQIDSGAKLYELPEDRKAGAKKARQADRKKPAKVNRERKVDETKKRLLEACKTPLENAGATALAMKTETEISFSYGEDTYTLKLTKHRPGK